MKRWKNKKDENIRRIKKMKNSRGIDKWTCRGENEKTVAVVAVGEGGEGGGGGGERKRERKC